MATPYFQLRFDSVSSTQDVARDRFEELPLLVIAAAQTEGRGRFGAGWENADRALAVSLIFEHDRGSSRPFSLMAGLAALRVTDGARLKWPNDVLKDGDKVGGILVERSDATTVVGLGLNLWWPDAPEGMGAFYDVDPGPDRHAEIGALWGAELMELIDADGWPAAEYRENCVTLGRHVSWEPEGNGRAVDIDDDGALLVEVDGVYERVVSGAVRHLRPSTP